MISLSGGPENGFYRTFDILQGSVVTHLMCGGIFSDTVIANFFPILTVKELCENQSIFGEVKAYQENGRSVWLVQLEVMLVLASTDVNSRHGRGNITCG